MPSILGWLVEWHLILVKQKYQETPAKCQNPLQTQMSDDIFESDFFCAWRNGQKNLQQVEAEDLNHEFWSLDYIFLGSTGASIKMFSKAFKHWCFSSKLSCLKPSLKTQLLTGSLNFKKIVN